MDITPEQFNDLLRVLSDGFLGIILAIMVSAVIRTLFNK